MTDDEFDQIYEESSCDGDRDKIIAYLFDQREKVKAQLPEGMRHCTIIFKKCQKGHGWLTAKNWVQHPCPHCTLEADKEGAAWAIGETHAILDSDESKIIRNTRDGYPEGRPTQVLTLQERVRALCKYASDWKRWCQRAEGGTPQV